MAAQLWAARLAADGIQVVEVRPGHHGDRHSRGWTEWTQGFQYGSAILQFDATGGRERSSTSGGRQHSVDMASHVSHIGVHDHGFNNVSTYGNLLRLMRVEGRIPYNPWEKNFYELALKVSGAVQAARWTELTPELGYIYSFNGPHSLFADTIRSLRALASATSSATSSWAKWTARSRSSRACSSTPRPPPASPSITARAATTTTCADAPRTSRSST
jgi:hypothetical protein